MNQSKNNFFLKKTNVERYNISMKQKLNENMITS
jgi:hypothetical protein